MSNDLRVLYDQVSHRATLRRRNASALKHTALVSLVLGAVSLVMATYWGIQGQTIVAPVMSALILGLIYWITKQLASWLRELAELDTLRARELEHLLYHPKGTVPL